MELGPTYSASYSWSDFDILESLVVATPRTLEIAVEIAAGPNLAVAHVLAEVAPEALYIPVDLQMSHTRLLAENAELACVFPLLCTASHLPLASGCADLVILHHAIDDVYESEGETGLWLTIRESVRVLAPFGRIILSHSILEFDKSTRLVSLCQVGSMLSGLAEWNIHREHGRLLHWMAVDQLTRSRTSRHV